MRINEIAELAFLYKENTGKELKYLELTLDKVLEYKAIPDATAYTLDALTKHLTPPEGVIPSTLEVIGRVRGVYLCYDPAVKSIKGDNKCN